MPRARISLGRPVRDGQPQKPRRSYPRHLAFVRSLSCCVCGRPQPIEAAHVRSGLPVDAPRGGVGLKPSDAWCVPLCGGRGFWGCHDNQHLKGENTFWSEHGDPTGLCRHLWNLSGKYEGDELIRRGERAVQRFRERVR